jgi:WhiB family redox-sensing transcriptional regulator
VAQLRQAQEICDQCPVIRDCLLHALRFPEQYGIWAGTSGNTREKLVKRIRAEQLDVERVVDTYLATN